jgi:hypothetical protein
VSPQRQESLATRGTPYHSLPEPTAEPEQTPPPAEIHQAVYPEVTPQKTEETRPPEIIEIQAPAAPTNSQDVMVGSTAAKPAPEHPLVAALRSFLDKKPAEAIAYLHPYEKANQEILLRMFPLLAELTQTPLSKAPPEKITVFREAFRNMEQPLWDRMELAMTKTCFCKSIKGFCNYEALEPGHVFLTRNGAGEQVNVYVELTNLSGVEVETPDRGKFYRTKLASSVKIVPRSGGAPIWQRQFKDCLGAAIFSRTLRRDYFNSYMFYVPHIPPGSYKLVIEVTDEPTGRKAIRSLDFRVSNLPAPS